MKKKGANKEGKRFVGIGDAGRTKKNRGCIDLFPVFAPFFIFGGDHRQMRARETKKAMAGGDPMDPYKQIIYRCARHLKSNPDESASREFSGYTPWVLMGQVVKVVGERPSDMHSLVLAKQMVGYRVDNLEWKTRKGKHSPSGHGISDEGGVRKSTKKRCREPGCDKPHKAKGLCNAHYCTLKRTESIMGEDGTRCSVADCFMALRTNGMCEKHYARSGRRERKRLRQVEIDDSIRHGDDGLVPIEAERSGSENDGNEGNAVSFRAV
jgi:hypothetical protein